MVPIQFSKIYRRLDSSKKFLGGSSFNLSPTVEFIDTDPQYTSEGEGAPLVYTPRRINIYISNKNVKPDSFEQMSLSDIVYTGPANPSLLIKMDSASTWICFVEESVDSGKIEAWTLDYFIRNNEDYNSISDFEQTY